MQLNEKELKHLEDHDVLCYANTEISHLIDPSFIKRRESSKDLAEFKRFLTISETDEEVAALKKAFWKYHVLFGYLKHFGIEDED